MKRDPTVIISLIWLVGGILLAVALAGCESRKDSPPDQQAIVGQRGNSSSTMGSALQEAQETFCWQGKPIHPAIVYELTGWLSDKAPAIVAVDVAAACDSNRYSTLPTQSTGSCHSCQLSSGDGPGSFEYERLGRLADGTHVLHTAFWGGGSGIFTDVLFVRFETDSTLGSEGKPRERLLMKSVGVFPVGDRDDGKIEVFSDRVVLGPSKNREHSVTLRVR